MLTRAQALDRATAQTMMEPLVRETLDNVFALGTTRALTGPVARGDAEVLTRQLAALDKLDPRIADAYRALNQIAAGPGPGAGRGACGSAVGGCHSIKKINIKSILI